jgi:hypothetical protein
MARLFGLDAGPGKDDKVVGLRPTTKIHGTKAS